MIKFELDLRYEAAAASELKENTQLDGSFYVPIVYWEKITQKIGHISDWNTSLVTNMEGLFKNKITF